ncbi:hypothetical protein GOBAR_DD13438 [Gossypium barbadense]|nr:hypothetical protein GOBAR_DD13438 [Gossypium barbadense]
MFMIKTDLVLQSSRRHVVHVLAKLPRPPMERFSTIIVAPAIIDVTMFSLCPGTDECSLAIYLSGFQQAVIIGLGTALMMPIIGNLSDQYGRKALLTLPMTLSIIPLAILACNRTTNYFYAYFAFKTLTDMVCQGSINCLALAYLADNISYRQRASAFGILAGVTSAAYVCGTLAARFLSTGLAFQVATFVSLFAVVYMRIFLEESIPADQGEGITQPILKEGEEDNIIQNDDNAPTKVPPFKKIPSLGDVIYLMKNSPSFAQAAIVAFFNNLGEGGMESSSMLFIMPLLVSPIGDGRLLSIGLFASCVYAILYSIAWSAWVPYAAAAVSTVMVFAPPSLRSIASRQAGPREQGKAQGCISGILSLANVMAPLIFSPLTSLFLSEGAPFHFPGFSIICIAITLMIAFIQSLMIGRAPSTSNAENSTEV